MRNNLHIVKRGDIWAVLREHAKRVSATAPTQEAANKAALPIAKREGLEVIIHGLRGRIREKNTYGKDPFPPKG